MNHLDWIGWVATAAFATSYFCRDPRLLRVVQAVAALLWLAYGILIHSMPVVASNAIVAVLAVGSSLNKRGAVSG